MPTDDGSEEGEENVSIPLLYSQDKLYCNFRAWDAPPGVNRHFIFLPA